MSPAWGAGVGDQGLLYRRRQHYMIKPPACSSTYVKHQCRLGKESHKIEALNSKQKNKNPRIKNHTITWVFYLLDLNNSFQERVAEMRPRGWYKSDSLLAPGRLPSQLDGFTRPWRLCRERCQRCQESLKHNLGGPEGAERREMSASCQPYTRGVPSGSQSFLAREATSSGLPAGLLPHVSSPSLGKSLA